MAVNETVIALLRPKPNMAKLADDPPHVQAAAQAAVDSPSGIGTIASYWTDVPLPATGTWNAPGKGGAQADLVLTAPQNGVPLLFIEVDNCHETAEELATKLEKYARFFRRTAKDTDGTERPIWRTRWTAPEGRYGDAPHPPVLLVFNRLGERNPDRTAARLIELTRHLWKGEWQREGYHLYDGKIPIIAATLENLSEHDPTGAVFLRFGRDHMQPLLEAIGNPAAWPPTPAPGKRPRVLRRSTRQRCSARRRSRPRKRQLNVRPAGRSAPAAGRSSPTNGGRRHRRRTGAPRRTPIRTCATTASRRPVPSSVQRLARRSARSRYVVRPGRTTSGPHPSVPSAPSAVPRSPMNDGRRPRASAGPFPRRSARLCAGTATSILSPTWTGPGV